MRKRVRTPYTCKTPSVTQQNQGKEANINNIMKKYEKTGILSYTSGKTPHFGDFSDIPDYQESLHRVMQAQDAFDSLPSALRKRFGNDPAQFINYLSENQTEQDLIDLGLLDEKKQDTNEGNAPQENTPSGNNPVDTPEP